MSREEKNNASRCVVATSGSGLAADDRGEFSVRSTPWSDKEKAAWEPAPAVSVAQWARSNIRLTKKMGASIPGAYDPDLTPWVHVLFEAFTERRVEGIVFVKPAQIGGSLTMQILISYVIDCEPANVIYFLDTDTNAKWASVHRVQPMIAPQYFHLVRPPVTSAS